jgi:tetratricopeptide (TPR) repeat protein
VKRWLAGEPVTAYPEPLGARLRRWVRRHQRPVIAMTAAALVATVASLVFATLISASNRRLMAANLTIRQKNAEITRQNQELEKTNKRLLDARTEAEQQRDQAREVTDFLVTSFRKPDPAEDGRVVTVAAVLSPAVTELEARTKMAPATRATILSAVGETYYHLGLLPESLRTYEQALSIRRAHQGADHSDTLNAMNDLAVVCVEAGQLDRALSLQEVALKIQRAKLGEDHPDTLTSMHNLAIAYDDAGQYDHAIGLFEQVLKRERTKLGPNHRNTLHSLHNLAATYLKAGQLDRAIPLLEQVVAAQAAKLGDDHPHTLGSMNSLAVAYEQAGKRDRAIDLHERVLTVQRTKLGDDHPDTLATRNNLAVAYRNSGQLDRAIPLLHALLKTHQARLVRDHPATLAVARNLAEAYEKTRRDRDAESLYRQVVEAAAKQKTRNDPFYGDSLALLGHCLVGQREHAKAVSVLRECLAIREKIQPDSWSTANARSLLGEALAGQKLFGEAEPFLLAGQNELFDRRAAIPAPRRDETVRAAAERLVRLYEAWNKPAEAEKWKKRAR